MIPQDWVAHRRDDGELIGWIRPEGDAWAAVDLLGRDVADAGEWLEVEAALEAHGIAWLADRWILEPDGGVDGAGGGDRVVLFVEVTPQHVVVKTDDYGAIDAPVDVIELAWPPAARLRPRRAGEHLPSGW